MTFWITVPWPTLSYIDHDLLYYSTLSNTIIYWPWPLYYSTLTNTIIYWPWPLYYSTLTNTIFSIMPICTVMWCQQLSETKLMNMLTVKISLWTSWCHISQGNHQSRYCNTKIMHILTLTFVLKYLDQHYHILTLTFVLQYLHQHCPILTLTMTFALQYLDQHCPILTLTMIFVLQYLDWWFPCDMWHQEVHSDIFTVNIFICSVSYQLLMYSQTCIKRSHLGGLIHFDRTRKRVIF
jgi:hypothetical protein